MRAARSGSACVRAVRGSRSGARFRSVYARWPPEMLASANTSAVIVRPNVAAISTMRGTLEAMDAVAAGPPAEYGHVKITQVVTAAGRQGWDSSSHINKYDEAAVRPRPRTCVLSASLASGVTRHGPKRKRNMPMNSPRHACQNL